MMSFLALNLQVAEASVVAIHDMPIVAATNAIASRRAIIFPFDVCIGLVGATLMRRRSGSARVRQSQGPPSGHLRSFEERLGDVERNHAAPNGPGPRSMPSRAAWSPSIMP